MESPSGTPAVRLSLLTLFTVALLVALVEPAMAGTEAAPEIQDAVGDQSVGAAGGPVAPCEVNCVGNGVDIVTVWIDNETAIQFNINIRMTGDIIGGQPFPVPGTPVPNVGSDTFTIEFTIGGTAHTVTVNMASGVVTLSDNANSALIAGNLMAVTILKSAVGSPTFGGVLSGFSVEVTRSLADEFPLPSLADRAPNEGAGAEYTFSGGGAPMVDPDDTDGDGMNDTCEMQYFGDLTHNETEDADGDTLTNGQECAIGTDPTKADSDGDGTNDNVDPAPTDPTIGGSSSTSSTGPTTPPPTTTSQTTTTSSTSRTTSVPAGDDGDVKNLSDAVEQLKSDPGYLGLSGGGFLAVLVLCIIALAVRWSL